jgi:hypothetical protein
VEASYSVVRDVICWRQSKSIGKTLFEKVIARRFAQANNGMLVDDDPAWDRTNTENESEMMKEMEARKLHTMAKVHHFLEMWQGSRNLCAIQKESRAQNQQMTAVEFISDAAEILKASASIFQHEGAAAFKLSERPPLPPACSAKDLRGRRTHKINIGRVR